MINKEYTYTFIIPHRNSPELLNRCLSSIPQRDDINIIVVDDNSDIGKKPTISRSDVQVLYIDADHTKGAGHARNVGLAAAKGKWILFADADDFYKEGFLEVLDRYKDSDIDVLYFNYDYKDGTTFETLPMSSVQKYIYTFDGSSCTSDYIKLRSKAPWNKMVSRNFINLRRIYFEEVPNGNDILFSMFTAVLSRKVAINQKSLYVYLKNPNSILTKEPSIEATICRITHDIKMVQLFKLFCPELKHSVTMNIFRKMKALGFRRGLKLLGVLIFKSCSLYMTRNEWIYLINDRKKFDI